MVEEYKNQINMININLILEYKNHIGINLTLVFFLVPCVWSNKPLVSVHTGISLHLGKFTFVDDLETDLSIHIAQEK